MRQPLLATCFIHDLVPILYPGYFPKETSGSSLAKRAIPGLIHTSMAQPPSQIGKSLPRPGRRLATRQVLDMQRAAYEASLVACKDAVDTALSPEQRARAATAASNLIRAWVAGEDRKRILRGRGLPKSVEAANAKPKRKAWNGPSFCEVPPN
jgi:hypothetical protein